MLLRKPRRLVKIREGPVAEADVLAALAAEAALAVDAAALAVDAVALAVDAEALAVAPEAGVAGKRAATKSASSRLIVVRR